MAIIKQHLALFLFNLAYVLGFGAYYLSIGNYEFLWYIAVLVFFLFLIGATLHTTQFSKLILWMLSLWGLAHMVGGGVQVGGAALYAFEIFHIIGSGDSFVLKFDQVVHFYGFFVSTFVIFHLLSRFVGVERGFKTLLLVSALSSIGLGAANEIVEFIAVLTIPDTGVGGYYNTSIDLVSNTLGAISAALILFFRNK